MQSIHANFGNGCLWAVIKRQPKMFVVTRRKMSENHFGVILQSSGKIVNMPYSFWASYLRKLRAQIEQIKSLFAPITMGARAKASGDENRLGSRG
jgi:hypothetical protein